MAIEMPRSQIVNKHRNTLCVVSRRWPPNGSAINKNLSTEINVSINNDTSDEIIASTPTAMQLHDVIHSFEIS